MVNLKNRKIKKQVKRKHNSYTNSKKIKNLSNLSGLKKSVNKEVSIGEILSQGLYDLDKLHKQEIENQRDKKLNSKITSLFYSTLICIVFAFIIFFNLSSYDLTSGFRLIMIIIMIIFIILIPILAARMLILYSKLKRHKKR